MNLNITEIKYDKLTVRIFPDRKLLGKSAAENISNLLMELLEIQGEARMIFAAAPSQNEFLAELIQVRGINWKKVTAFHMDEYLGLDTNSDQLFSKYLTDKIFSKVHFKTVHMINPQNDTEKECKRYESLLKEKPIDIVCMGIGENGHIAFNDPPADFNDPHFVKIVELDQPCRQQQVNDGCFPSLDKVPEKAVTLTVPALMSGKHLSVVVPGKNKADAVKRSLLNEISTLCPGSIIREHNNVILYLDRDSASKINTDTA